MKRVLMSALLAASALVGLAAPAAATTEVAGDIRGDVWLSRVDIVSQGVSYSDTGFTLAAGAARPVDPSIWTDTTGIIWAIDVNLDGTEDYKAYLLLNLAILDDAAGNEVCRGVVGYDGTLVFASFAASCIGNAPHFRLEDVFWTDTNYSDAYDFGPQCCLVYRGAGTPAPPPPPPVEPNPILVTAGTGSGGYWMITKAGQVHGFGAQALGDGGFESVDIEPTPSGKGYLALTERGEVHGKGDARYFGNAALPSGEKATSISVTPSGNGYWIFSDKGRVLEFGDAQHFGDVSDVKLNGPVLGSVATPSGKGYWMVGSDGGVFSFGDAKFYGSTGNVKLNKPVMALAADPDGVGYWLVASDGGIFAFDAPFYGSTGHIALNKPISGMVPGKGGYMMVGQDGGIFSFGQVPFHGSLGANPPASPVVSVALQP
jgi:hypothetical protein